jgi:hypothetical protein
MKTLIKHKCQVQKPPSASLVRRVYKQRKSERATAQALLKQGFKTSRSAINGVLRSKEARVETIGVENQKDGKKISAQAN